VDWDALDLFQIVEKVGDVEVVVLAWVAGVD
jgi:hypothetical protein